MVLGIDLGTTYSVGAYLDERGDAQVVVNMEGSRTTPSVVYFEGADSVVVGQIAKDNAVMYPKDVISAVKNSMGDKKTYLSSFGKSYTPEMISSFILKKVVSDANKYLNPSKDIKDVVITIPAYFTDAQRVATEDAAKIAGLNLLGTINEPTAAALYYASKSGVNHANIMIYDLGGGTFDVTIIRIDDDNIEVKATGGLSKVGGRFFDEDIVSFVRDVIEEKYDVDLEDDEYLEVYQELFEYAEKAKIQLSTREKADIIVKSGSIREKVTITRADFEKIVSKLYDRTERIVKKLMKENDMSFSDLSKVILVGGSSRIPYIENKLTALTGITPSHEVNPDEVVAMGAALYARQLTAGKAGDKIIYDVCSHSIGVVTVDAKTYEKVNSIVIKRNTKLPTEGMMRFKTITENQEQIELTITEGEFEEVSDVTIISKTMLDLPSRLPIGTPGKIVLKLDASQIVHVFVNIDAIGFEQEFTFERTANLSKKDIELLTGIIADYEIN